MTPEQAVIAVLDEVEAAQAEYLIVGALAYGAWGIPRSTKDADFVLALPGLEVDVILRRVDDTFCDPLELREDSFLGVAGLVEAARAGNVTIANALGSGIMESPAFLAFLPGLCQRLLGEELKLPSVATWWCGHGNETFPALKTPTARFLVN